MISIEKFIKVLIVLFAIVLSLWTSIAEASKPISIPDAATAIRRLGYPCDTPEQIAAACKSNNTFVRLLAVELLMERGGREAIPALKVALKDEEFEIRWRAAHWLGTQGDKSGLESMRQDLSEFGQALDAAPSAFDPNRTVQPNEVSLLEGRRNLHLHNAVIAAKVMAELGDPCGYDLTVRVAIEGPWTTQRCDAVACLTEIATLNSETLKAKKMDPVSMLCSIAESEQDTQVLIQLLTCTETRLHADTALQILKYARDAPNKSEEAHKIIRVGMEHIQAKKKSGGDQKHSQNNP